jgi:predicted helicase
MVDWGREEVMKQMLYPNFALCAVRVGRDQQAHNYFITNLITDKSVTSSLDNANVFPLFSYQENPLHDSIDVIPNLDNKTLTEFAKSIHLVYKPELDVINNAIDITGEPTEVRPVDFFDYIYAVLYSPAYRDKYKDFLKVDFPRIPYPTGQSSFWLLARLGRQLRKIHLLESEKVEGDIASYPMSGDNILRKPSFMIDQKNHTGRVWLNETQYFDYVSEVAWNFSIGGYQPAQKWLKDRVGRTLSYDDILHYQKIIVALSETDRIMKEIEKIPLE